jgi:hypothetical protein
MPSNHQGQCSTFVPTSLQTRSSRDQAIWSLDSDKCTFDICVLRTLCENLLVEFLRGRCGKPELPLSNACSIFLFAERGLPANLRPDEFRFLKQRNYCEIVIASDTLNVVLEAHLAWIAIKVNLRTICFA